MRNRHTFRPSRHARTVLRYVGVATCVVAVLVLWAPVDLFAAISAPPDAASPVSSGWGAAGTLPVVLEALKLRTMKSAPAGVFAFRLEVAWLAAAAVLPPPCDRALPDLSVFLPRTSRGPPRAAAA